MNRDLAIQTMGAELVASATSDAIKKLESERDAANARAEQMQKERDENKLAVAALARKLAQLTRNWAKAGNVDNSAEYWTAWAYADAHEAAKRGAGEGAE